MTGKDLLQLGFAPGPAVGVALLLIPEASKHLDQEAIKRELKAVLDNPVQNAAHPYFAELARVLREDSQRPVFRERPAPAPFKIWGEGLEATAVEQIRQAARLPVAVQGALMPDAHLGYGLPIGGVLATENAVIPYAVGVDIACRMKLSVLDIPAKDLDRLSDQLVRTLQRETKFGTGVEFQKPLEHEVLDEDWSVTPVTKKVFDKARAQLGTSGSGNHFVEFGILTLDQADLGLEAGQYLAVLSHSGSRGSGATVADYYSRLARDRHPELPPELSRLSWLDLDLQEGQEYWAAMNLMGKYAAANHAMIHRNIGRALGAKVIAGVENHHNFAWKEQHGGKDVIVHRKGATPAGKGVLGVIPGSMATPGLCRPRQGRTAVARKRRARRGPTHESHGRPREIPLGAFQADARRRRRPASLRRHRRSAGCL